MQLTLSDAEAFELRALITRALGDLSTEIANTDNASFRRGLQERRASLQQVLRALEGAGPTS